MIDVAKYCYFTDYNLVKALMNYFWLFITLFDYSSAIIVFAVLEYWFVGCLYFIVDITGKPTFLYQYKVQQNAAKVSVMCNVGLSLNLTVTWIWPQISSMLYFCHVYTYRTNLILEKRVVFQFGLLYLIG